MSSKVDFALKDEAIELLVKQAYMIDGPVSVTDVFRDPLSSMTFFRMEMDEDEIKRVADDVSEDGISVFSDEMWN